MFVVIGPRFRRLLGAHGPDKTLAIAFLCVVISASLITFLERDNDGPITNLGDDVWWAMTTVAAVGYGDACPTPPRGRGVGAFLMLIGIGLYGIVAAKHSSSVLHKTGGTRHTRLDLA